MKVDGSLRSLLQGVSQQPARTRLPGQCEAQENCSSNPVDGLTRRPPMDQIKALFTSSSVPQWYDFSLGDEQEYTAAILNGGLRVFDTLTGTEKTVNVLNSATNYLDGGKCVNTTLDGTTYIVNRSKVVKMQNTTAPYVNTGSIVFLLGAQYGRLYTLNIVWSGTTITVSYQAPNGGTATDTPKIATDYVAKALETALNANATFTSNFAVSRGGDILYIRKTSAPTTQDFEVTVVDGDGGVNMIAVNNTVKDASKLPKYAPQGYIVKISGTTSSSADDWYVKFDALPDSAGNKPAMGAGFGREGLWLECVAPDVPYEMDNTTMPIVLTYDEGTDQFTLDYGSWAGRQVGDEDSNANPTFIDRTINGIGYFQGRLVFVSGPAVIMSRTDHPLDFWRQSATLLADSDPIDIESTAEGVREMLSVIPHNRDLVVFSDGGQFIVFGRNSITPVNCSLVLTTAFEADLTAAPVPAGRNVFFAIKFGKFAGIREFFTESSIDANDSRPITQHVLKYIEGQAAQMATTSNFDNLVVRTTQDPRKLYLYEYIWDEDKKAQSSWSRWNMPNDVVHVFFRDSVLYCITKIDTTYYMNKLDLDTQPDAGLTYQTKLDRKKTVTGVTTTISNPYTQMPDVDQIVFVQGEGCPYPGMRVLYDSYSGGVFHLKDNMNGGTVIVGIRYRSSYIPTMPMVKDEDRVKIGTGTLIVAKFMLNYAASGTFWGRIISKYAEDVIVKFTGRFVGDPSTVVGQPAITDGTAIMPFRHNADLAMLEVFTDSHEPLTLMDIEWAGQYSKKGRRIVTGGG